MMKWEYEGKCEDSYVWGEMEMNEEVLSLVLCASEEISCRMLM